MDFEKIVTLIWMVFSLGPALVLLLVRDCLFVPVLVCIANAIGLVMWGKMDYKLLSLVPCSVTSILAFIVAPGLASTVGLVVKMLFWAAAVRFYLWAIKWAMRKETTQTAARVRKQLYRWMGYIGYASTTPPGVGVPEPLPRGQVTVVRTAKLTGERLSVHPRTRVEPGEPGQGEVTIIVSPKQRYQTLLGFGGAFTETSAELLQQLGSANQERIIDSYFREGMGIGYQIGRLHMNSCDFSKGNWSCCEEPHKQGDKELKNFSIAHYHKAILPMVKRAAAAAGRPLVLFASPWSPPAWMKDTGAMLDGGRLRAEFRALWASFYVRFAELLKEAGFPLWGFTVQNEPDAANGWENCLFSAEEERDFIRDYLGPAVEASGSGLKLLAWDHNRDDLFRRAFVIEKDPAAAKYLWGYGYHWYGDIRYDWWADPMDHSCFDNVRCVHELCPEKHLMVTEVCQELGSHLGDWQVAERYAESIIRDFNNWCEAWVDWNLILDHEGGPNHHGNMCSAPIIVDTRKDLVIFQPSFCYIGQFSRYIRPGAQRVLCATNRAQLQATAFVNPDETLVLVVLNMTDNLSSYCITHCEGWVLRYNAEPHSITTFIFGSGEAEQASTTPAEEPKEKEASAEEAK